MDQEKASARKRKRNPKEGNAGVRKRNRRRGAGAGAGEPQKQADAAPVAAVVQKVEECMQNEEEEYPGITEESMAQMMSWLALELGAAAPPAPAAGYVTVQGGMESCGPSFSGPASTVMASVDFRFVAPVPPVVEWPLPEAVPVPQQEEETVDDDWVTSLLTDGPTWEGQYDC